MSPDRARRLANGYILIALAAAVAIVGAAVVARGYPRGSWERIGLALVQGLATTAVIVLHARSLRHLDELQQRIQLEALSFAFFGTAILAVSYGFLQNAGLPSIEWGTLIWPVSVGLWAAGLLLANRRYR